MTGNKAGKRSGRNAIHISPSATGKQDGAVVDRESSEIEDMSIQALVEGAVSGMLKGEKTGEGLKGPKPRIIGKNFNPFSLIVLADLSTIET